MKLSNYVWVIVSFVLGVMLTFTEVGALGLLLVAMSFFLLVASLILGEKV